MFREAVGIFDDPEQLNAAVVELETTAFPRDAISVLGGTEALKKEFGMPYVRPEDAEDNPDAPRDAFLRPEEKVIGISAVTAMAIYAALTVAVIMSGPSPTATGIAVILFISAVVGILVFLITRTLANRYTADRRQQIEAGGMVLWVRTPAPEQEDIARTILGRHGAKDVHVHTIN
jgi:uncharacterized membrane protein YtjA (UPF0391 family)